MDKHWNFLLISLLVRWAVPGHDRKGGLTEQPRGGWGVFLGQFLQHGRPSRPPTSPLWGCDVLRGLVLQQIQTDKDFVFCQCENVRWDLESVFSCYLFSGTGWLGVMWRCTLTQPALAKQKIPCASVESDWEIGFVNTPGRYRAAIIGYASFLSDDNVDRFSSSFSERTVIVEQQSKLDKIEMIVSTLYAKWP